MQIGLIESLACALGAHHVIVPRNGHSKQAFVEPDDEEG